MANTQGVNYGARPFTTPASPPIVMPYRVETSSTIQYFKGQFAVINSNGRVETVVGTASGGMISCGVIWGFTDLSQAGLPTGMASLTQGAFLPVSTDAYAQVIIDPNQLYVMEEITGGTAIVASSIGLGVDFTYICATGNTQTGIANSVLRNVALTNGTSNMLQIVGLLDITNQDGTANASGASAKWVVRIARHQFGNNVFPNGQTLSS